MVLRGISPPFGGLSPCCGQVVQVILTLTPLYKENRSSPFSCDLHALTTPPTFVLSQDQTLHLRSACPLRATSVSNVVRVIIVYAGQARRPSLRSEERSPGARLPRTRKAHYGYLFTFQRALERTASSDLLPSEP